MNALFYTSLVSFMLPQAPAPDKMLRFYSTDDENVSYCAPVISNGTIYTQLDISGTQRQDVHYTYHGKNGSKQDMIPGVYLAGRRYNAMQRPLIPFGYFEEQSSVGGSVLGNAEKAAQILDIGRGASGCRNDYANGLSIFTHAFVHRDMPVVAVRKKFTGRPADFQYRFDYYYANAGVERTKVKWSDFTITALPDNRGAVIRYRIEGMQTLDGAVTIISPNPAQKIEIDGFRVSFIFDEVPETAEFFMLYTDSLNDNDWEKQQQELITLAETQKFDGLFATHAAGWENMWSKFDVDIPDDHMESVFYSAIYNLVCTSTPWGVPVGVHPYSWNGNYFGFNLFVSLFCMSNNREAAARIPAFRRKTLANAIARTTNWVHSAGARFPWVSDEDGFYECSTPGVWQDHIFHMGNISLEAWDYYNYTRDIKFLRETAYPVISKCAEFFMQQAIYDIGDGKIIIGKCCDLERLGTARANAFLTTCSAICTLDIAANAAARLGVDAEIAAQWRETAGALRRNLPTDGTKYLPFPGCEEKSIGVFGGLYPYFVLDPDDPRQLAAINDYLGSTAEAGNMYPFGKNICTWYASWVANGMIRIGDSAKAIDYLQKASISAGAFDITYEINEPGIFVSHPWCSEPPACYTQGIMELLCRAQGNTLLLCAGVENIWENLSYTLGAPDDLNVTLKLENGKVTLLKISAGSCYSGEITRIQIPGKIMDLNIKANETITLIGKE